jgi:hypothetical protein
MLGSNPSADSVASTDPKGDASASPFPLRVKAPIGRGIKALNPGGAGAKPLRHSLSPLRRRASSHNACIALLATIHNYIPRVKYLSSSSTESFRGQACIALLKQQYP